MKPFLSIPDPFLSKESSIDPMGVQKIWTDLAQNIFGKKLTTIANDIRVFSINIFHHYFLWKYHQEFKRLAAGRYKELLEGKDDRNLKLGLLIAMEDLCTLSFVLTEENIDKERIPGSNRAKAKLESNQLKISADRGGGFLRNQVNLGMSGRYKGPMMAMEILQSNLGYKDVNNNNLEKISELFKKWNDTKDLENALRNFLINVLFKAETLRVPALKYEEFKNRKAWTDLMSAYIKCFGKKKLPGFFKEYFKESLGLNNGAAKIIYDSLDASENSGINVSRIFNDAFRNCKEDTEKNKIKAVLEWAPVISHAEQTLRKIAHTDSKTIDGIKKDLEYLRERINSLPMPGFNGSEGVKVYKDLLDAVRNDKPFNDWVTGIVEHHHKIMKNRGGEKWISLNEKNEIRHFFSTRPAYSDIKEYIKDGYWNHHYYLYTLKEFKAILG